MPQRGRGRGLLSSSATLPELHLKVSLVPSAVSSCTVKWAGCRGHASVTGGNEIPKRTQSGHYTQYSPQYRKPIKPVQHAINKNRQIFVGPWPWSRREKCRCRATIVCLHLPLFRPPPLPSSSLAGNKNDDVIEQRKMYGPRQRRRLRLRLRLDLDCSHVKS